MRKRRKKRKINIILPALLLLACLVITGFSPLFSIRTIEIVDLEKYSRDEILQKANIKEGQNIFMAYFLGISKELEQNHYIKECHVDIKFPDKVILQIEERRVRGYVPYAGTYLYIDEQGRVLEAATEITNNRPIVQGLSFDTFTEGEILDIDNKAALDAVVQISKLMEKYEMTNYAMMVDVSNVNDLKIKVDNIDILLGTRFDLEYKIKVLAQTLPYLPDNAIGKMEMQEVDKQKKFVFQHYT